MTRKIATHLIMYIYRYIHFISTGEKIIAKGTVVNRASKTTKHVNINKEFYLKDARIG